VQKRGDVNYKHRGHSSELDPSAHAPSKAIQRKFTSTILFENTHSVMNIAVNYHMTEGRDPKGRLACYVAGVKPGLAVSDAVVLFDYTTRNRPLDQLNAHKSS
jgi:hypothetical protein